MQGRGPAVLGEANGDVGHRLCVCVANRDDWHDQGVAALVFSDAGGAEALLGVVCLCFVAASLLVNRRVRDSSSMPDSRPLLIGSLLSGVPLIGVALSGVLWLALPLYLLHVLGETFKDPILYGVLQHEVDSDNRATVESFYSLMTSLAETVGFLMMGCALDRCGMQVVICLCAALFVISGVFASGRVNERHANAKSIGHPAGS